ncbi:hypothetical protein Cpa01nite_34300 [Cellulomonas pakistanensis]|uniref:Uncharacterized protein n=1 Tax=Cellulomonas pakistanensis TaxID=992287 RepID=A0A919U7I9_9CELL|nr:hypothetical protein Cpa01nite_34300 [Cellulomonas pakistanensis]
MFSELPEREARTARLDPQAGPEGGTPRYVTRRLAAPGSSCRTGTFRQQCRVNHAQSTPESLVGFRRSKAVETFTENDSQKPW